MNNGKLGGHAIAMTAMVIYVKSDRYFLLEECFIHENTVLYRYHVVLIRTADERGWRLRRNTVGGRQCLEHFRIWRFAQQHLRASFMREFRIQHNDGVDQHHEGWSCGKLFDRIL